MPKNSNRALRRFNRARVIKKRTASKQYDGHIPEQQTKGKLAKNSYVPEYGTYWKDAKDWNLLWRRGQKNRRAQKLGFEHPRKPWREHSDITEQPE